MLTKLAIILLVGSFGLSAVLTAIVRKLALKWDFVSRPVEDRFHDSVVPLGGGIAIYATIAAALIAGIIAVRFIIMPGHLDNFLGESVTVHTAGFLDKIPRLLIILGCLTVLFALGLADDKKHLGPFVKLAVQLAVAFVAALAADVRVEMFIESRLITSLLSAFWIVLIINAFNFLDNMDGASAGIAVIASAILFVAAAISGQVFIGAMAVLFAGTLLGFLFFNFPPAMVFMGDAGSLVVGFMVALLTLRTTYYHQGIDSNWYPVLMPLIVMAVPLYDFVSVTLLRISQGKSPFVGDTQHFSHRLKRRGLSETQTVLTLYLATLVTGLGATFLYQVNLAGAVLIFAQTVMILAIIAVLESASSDFRHEGTKAQRELKMTALKERNSKFNWLLLGICLCVLAIRAAYTESINAVGSNPWLNFNSDFHSLCLSMVLLAAVVLWFIYACLNRKITYCFTGLEIGLALFAVAGFIGIAVASNKRAAVTEFVSFLIPVLTAVMLVQILDSHSKIRLVLIVLVGLGVASAVQCAGQYFVDTQMMIDQYEIDPDSILAPLGITPGSFNQMLFEHRLYTRGVSGFLMTSNSVGSFSILAFFAAVALFAEQLKKYIRRKDNPWLVVATGIAMLVVLLNLIIVRSKGAAAAFIVAFVIFVLLVYAGRWIAAHRKITLIICLVIAIAAGFLVVSYGQTHSRLPGGNSMLVRWQYWVGAAKMYADHSLTGVGPGNFSTYYTQYKAPAALETVKDPHNFLLSLLAQYGPLGLVGFLLMLLSPCYSALKIAGPYKCEPQKTDLLSPRVLLAFVIAIAAVLLFIRPILKPIAASGEPAAAVLYVIFTIYCIPVAAFFIGIWFACGLFREERFVATNLTAAALIAAVVGLIIHNLIDFAIFEMGIYTSLWVIIAVIVAMRKLHQPEAKVFNIGVFGRAVVFILIVVAVIAFFMYGLIPVAIGTSNTAKARKSYEMGFIDGAQQQLAAAADADTLNPVPYMTKGRLALREYHNYAIPQTDKLLLAEKSYLQALRRDATDFATYEHLTEIYELLSDNDKSNKAKWLNKAFEASKQAVKLYPGLGRLRLKLAQIAESLSENTAALENYKEAVAIEDAYREQFKIMYPGREIFSRLGQENYDLAKQRVADLQSKSNTDK